MSWLNFNNSLNTLKGQISNFASNVLADEDEGPEVTEKRNEDLKNICLQQEIEIGNLKRINEELSHEQVPKNDTNNISSPKENWNWDVNDQQSIANTALSDLKQQIDELQNEKRDLIGQLEQLDLENQQNLLEIVSVKEKLQDENSELKDKFLKLREEYDIISKQDQEKPELTDPQRKLDERDKTKDLELYREKYEKNLQENQILKLKVEEAQREISVLNSSNITLQKVLEDYKIATEEEAKNSIEKLKQLESENKIIYVEFQKAKEDIKQYEKKSYEDTENCQKLALILESYEKQVCCLKQQLEEQNKKFVQSKVETNDNNKQEEINSLMAGMETLKIENKYLQEVIDKLTGENLKKTEELKSVELNQEVNSLKEELSILQSENDKLIKSNTASETRIKYLKQELENHIENHKNILLQLHNKYVNIITENIKKIQDCDRPSDVQHCLYEDDPQISEFSKHVEDILKILIDFKCKCEILEKNIYNLTEEKTKILTEKNHEIEKLIQNSEILSQEVITKTQIIKDFEKECNELAKNNEILINEVDNFKNNSGLQTISESNEDNMVLLESQLENANKRIEDLEKIIDDFEKQQTKEDDLESMNKLQTSMQQLQVTEAEIANKQKDYQELLNSFDQLQIEFDNLKYDLETAKGDLKYVNEENVELKSNLEKIKSDYENTEYQLSESKINYDGLKEEIEGCRKKIDSLMSENGKLQLLNEENCNNNEDMRNELSIVREQLTLEENNRKKLEIQIRNLTEKLQNAKMSETSLKLQYDTVSKEVIALSDANHNLQISLSKTNSELTQFQNKFLEIQYQNGKLLKDYEELKNTASNRENQLKNFEELVTELQTKLGKYEELALDENNALLKKLSIGDNLKVIEDLKSQLAIYEPPMVYENEQLFKNLSLTESRDLPGTMDVDVKEINKEYEELKQQFDMVMEEKNNLQVELDRVKQFDLRESLGKQMFLQEQLKDITNSRNDLINIVTNKHQESLTYHNEIKRLSQVLTVETEKCKNLEMQLNQLKNSDDITLKNEEIEKLVDQNNFLKEKCEIMARNLLEEQSKVQRMLTEKSNPSEKELTLQKKLDRLQTHLVELEEHYTQELLQAEQKNTQLQAKVNELEEREKSSSTMYTSVSIRANQQVESLQNQLQNVIVERDGLRKKISDAEDLNNKQAAALANLQFVLEQFQKDKEKDVIKETERIRRQINAEKRVQEELKNEIISLKSQLEESKQGLQAASRLSDQLEYSKKVVATLKEEVSQLQEKLAKSEEKLKNVASQTDGKVDKSLIKNLIIGFISSNNNLNKDQLQILKIIATVLDFNQQDHEKVNLNKLQQGSWLSSFLFPQHGSHNISAESLSQAFIRFLENESKPRVVPSLLNASKSDIKSASTSKSSTPRQSPIVLSEIVLPTFADFAQNRNSSAILKDVLKDNS